LDIMRIATDIGYTSSLRPSPLAQSGSQLL